MFPHKAAFNGRTLPPDEFAALEASVRAHGLTLVVDALTDIVWTDPLKLKLEALRSVLINQST